MLSTSSSVLGIAGKKLCLSLFTSDFSTSWLHSVASHSHQLPCVENEKADMHLVVHQKKRTKSFGEKSENEMTIKINERGDRQIAMYSHFFNGTLLHPSNGPLTGEFWVGADVLNGLSIVLRTCLSFLCEDAGELLLHASGLMDDNGVWLFVGGTGAGKTTIATELNKGKQILGLDRVVLGVDQEGTVIAHSTPFSDPDGLIDGPKTAKVAGIYFISQSHDHNIGTMTEFEVLTGLLPQTLAFSRDTERVGKIMTTVQYIAMRQLCSRLEFRKDDLFWNLLRSS